MRINTSKMCPYRRGGFSTGVVESEMSLLRKGLHQQEVLEKIAPILGGVVEPRIVQVEANEPLVVVVVLVRAN